MRLNQEGNTLESKVIPGSIRIPSDNGTFAITREPLLIGKEIPESEA